MLLTLSLLLPVSAFAQAENTTVVVNNVIEAVSSPKVCIEQVVGWVATDAVIFGILATFLFIILGIFSWITSG